MEASESLDKLSGESPGANTEAAAWMDMQLMWPGTINPLIVINVSGRDYASAEVSEIGNMRKCQAAGSFPARFCVGLVTSSGQLMVL